MKKVMYGPKTYLDTLETEMKIARVSETIQRLSTFSSPRGVANVEFVEVEENTSKP